MLSTIMIPYDGSDAAALAFPYAELFPSRAVRLVRVEPSFQVLAPGPLENFRPDWRTVRTEQIRQELAQFAERFRSQGRTVEIVVRFGDPAEEIIAAGEDTDLIIMTTQGRGTAGRALFGSVADRVSRHARTPTLLVRATVAQSTSPRIARIVVPLDGSPLAEHALPLAASLATDLDLPIHLLRVVDPYEITEEMHSGRWRQDAGAAAGDAFEQERNRWVITALAYLEGIAEQLRARGLTVKADVHVGRAAPALLDALRSDDVAVMTSQGRGGMARWLLGSVAEQVIRAAHAPVLLVRATDADSHRAILNSESSV